MRFRICQQAAVIALLILPPHARGEGPIRVEARVPKGTFYAGQAIEVRVVVLAGGERPKVTPPRVDGAEVAAAGDVTTEADRIVSRFRVVPSRPGPLLIPPFVARIGEHSGSSSPIRLTIKAVPIEGRPASYLRGVGRIEARAEAVPASVRVGQAFEYRLVLKGPGARGSSGVPALPEFAGLTWLKVEPVGTVLDADPPARTLRFRARPTSAGEFTLPSVAIATFDPDMHRYVEARAPSVKVLVVDVPRFDPSSLASSPDEARPPSRFATPIAATATVLVLSAWVLLAIIRRRTSTRRWARVVARGLIRTEPTDVAARVSSGLTAYLARSIGHPCGELTPDEAEHGISRAVGDPALAARARLLIERSDRARFGDPAADAGLALEASTFFDELARSRIARKNRGRQSRPRH